ncbi:YdcF family protein [Amycolatopsis sp. FDAARGOS 1241]|uniref:YdcF family protein n=1 Tax=Amycolatopsis sp. FDAARGOS 1241 TaxID=2778070 RepID=UPI001EF2B817|nr:YdcF family protein [Amycolatopsis sp. FDAARGOS 1241]
MGYLITSIPFFAGFAISFRFERRRMLNGVLLLAGLLLVAIGGLFALLDLPAVRDRVSGGELVFLAFLVLTVLLPAFLVLNGLQMVRREGRRLGNLLSLLAGVAIFGFAPLLLMLGKNAMPRALEVVVISAGFVVGYLSLAFAAFVLCSVGYGLLRPPSGADFLVVHGSRLIRGAVPPLLASRLDRARTLYAAGAARGAAPTVITSGGQGADEALPEAVAMADYLVEHGISRAEIVLEDRSTTTRENLVYSRELMTARNPGYRCLLITNNFHAFRTAMLARRLKVNGQVIGSRTAWYYIPSATIREFAGILRDYRVLNAAVIVLIAAAYPVSMLFQPH